MHKLPLNEIKQVGQQLSKVKISLRYWKGSESHNPFADPRPSFNKSKYFVLEPSPLCSQVLNVYTAHNTEKSNI